MKINFKLDEKPFPFLLRKRASSVSVSVSSLELAVSSMLVDRALTPEKGIIYNVLSKQQPMVTLDIFYFNLSMNELVKLRSPRFSQLFNSFGQVM